MKVLSVAAAFALGASAGADVRYTFTSVFGSFAFVAPAPIAKKTRIPSERFSSSKGFLGAKVVSAEFQPGWAESDTLVVVEDDRRTYTFVFPKGAFAAPGTSATRVGIRGQLTALRGVPAKPPKKPSKRP